MTRKFPSERLPPDEGRRTKRAGPEIAVSCHDNGDWLVVELAGELDIATVPLAERLMKPSDLLAVDVAGLTFIDCRGLGMLTARARAAVAAGGCLRLVAPSRAVRKLLDIAELQAALPVFDSLDGALSAPLANPSPDDHTEDR
ncbi:STAS domain-containing protein [Nocardioides iriomotensis]|uniref:Anti-sigma factor antagonist n=1 Tax=Nocardioides iriomotensis TaxID=715784 RepID=A0A4Q5IX58_9ACTN|nr:STAS domain-containing protein [Nocardioides iriomotensis]RYU10710.1 anti-sigma factor antagonist [Nocardioides iriomotensis]